MTFAANPLPPEDLAHVLKHTRELWEEARGKRFFITGGTGFFGMWLLESFAHVNDHLGLRMRAVVLTRNVAAFAKKAPHLAVRPDLEFIEGDVRTFAFPVDPFPYVIHAATEASAKLNDEAPDEMLDAIIAGTRHVLKFSAQAGTKKFLLTSSGAVYGRQPPALTHVGEDYAGAPDPLQFGSAYGIGKRVAEHMTIVQARTSNFEAKIARCFAFVGPHLPLDAHFAIGNFIRDALANKPIQINGDGTPQRSYLYAADLAIWLWTMLFRAPSARAYNVGSDQGLSILETAQAVSAAVGSIPVLVSRKPVPGAEPSRYVPATNRIRQELSLAEIIPLAEALQRTLAWQRTAGTSPASP